MKKLLECFLGALLALSIGALIAYVLLGAIIEGKKITYYNDVMVFEESK